MALQKDSQIQFAYCKILLQFLSDLQNVIIQRAIHSLTFLHTKFLSSTHLKSVPHARTNKAVALQHFPFSKGYRYLDYKQQSIRQSSSGLPKKSIYERLIKLLLIMPLTKTSLLGPAMPSWGLGGGGGLKTAPIQQGHMSHLFNKRVPLVSSLKDEKARLASFTRRLKEGE